MSCRTDGGRESARPVNLRAIRQAGALRTGDRRPDSVSAKCKLRVRLIERLCIGQLKTNPSSVVERAPFRRRWPRSNRTRRSYWRAWGSPPCSSRRHCRAWESPWPRAFYGRIVLSGDLAEELLHLPRHLVGGDRVVTAGHDPLVRRPSPAVAALERRTS